MRPPPDDAYAIPTTERGQMTSDFALDQPTVNLEIAPDELAGIIEALHDGVLRRVRWTVYSDQNFEKWRELDIKVVQQVMNGMTGAYAKAVMVYRDAQFKNQGSFEAAFLWPDEVFDVIYEIIDAESWEDLKLHPVHSPEACKVCCAVFGS